MLYQIASLISVHYLVFYCLLSYFWELVLVSKLNSYYIEIYLVCFSFNNTFYKLIIKIQILKLCWHFGFPPKNMCFVRQDCLLECIKKKMSAYRALRQWITYAHWSWVNRLRTPNCLINQIAWWLSQEGTVVSW